MMRTLPLLLLASLWLLPAGTLLAEDPPKAETGTEPAAGTEGAPPAAPAKSAAELAYEAERKLATELQAQLKGPEALTIKAGDKEVLALLQPQTRGKAEGGVLLLHDLNAHPDWPGVIHQLRRELPAAGWHTLSLQLPRSASVQITLEQLDAIRPRIDAALAEYDRRGIKNIVFIGHGQGAHAAIDYLANSLLPVVQGLVVIGLDGSPNSEPRLDAAAALGGVANMPILDLYGERDLATVVSTAQRRYDLARRPNDAKAGPRTGYADVARDYTEKKGLGLDYRQIRVSGADHNFASRHPDLVKRVRGWLKRYASGSEIKPSNTPESPP